MAHAAGVPVEAELGAVMGHEAGPLPPYEELFASGKGFTAPEEAKRFVEETGADWLSVAIMVGTRNFGFRRQTPRSEMLSHVRPILRTAYPISRR